MAYPRRRPTYRRRRPTYRRRPVARRTAVRPVTNYKALALMRNPCPLKRIVNLKFVDSFYLGAGGVPYDNKFYRTNSLNQPPDLAATHQPLYFDQMATLYGAYKVLRSTAVARFSYVNDVITDYNNYVSVDTSADKTSSAGILSLERPGVRAHMLPTEGSTVLKCSWSLRAARANQDDSQWAAATTSDPTSLNYFRFSVMNPMGTAIGANYIQVLVTMYFTALFEAPLPVAQS